MKEAQGKYEVRNVWTTDGRILYKGNNKSISLPKVRSLSGTETVWYIFLSNSVPESVQNIDVLRAFCSDH